MKRRPRVPIGLPISIAATLIIGLVAGPIIRSTATEEQLATNVLLSAIPFVFIFVSIILAFITLIWLVVSVLNHNISERVYRPIELTLIGGIILGVIGMFQPWFFMAYRIGFYLLFISTLAFILWSHIAPRGRQLDHLGGVSVRELEEQGSEG